MQQTINQLSYDEQTIINQTVQKYQISNKNHKVLLKYYNHFNKVLSKTKNDLSQIKTMAQIALIFTEKSNFYETIEGKRTPGICFSMKDILRSKSYAQIQNITNLCREIIEKVKFKQNGLTTEVQRLSKDIENGLQEAILFESLSLVFYQNTLQTSKEFQLYKQKLISFSWYLYIDAKHKLHFQNQTFLMKKFLMISVIQTIVLNSLEHIHFLILEKSSPKKHSISPNIYKKELMSAILDILLKQVKIEANQIIYYKKASEMFDLYFDELIEKSIIKSITDQRFDFLSPRSLDINFGKIDRKISKQVESSEIDLRKFIDYEVSMEKNHKKTAIQDKLIIKHKKTEKGKALRKADNENIKNYKSHRVLDLDHCDLQMSSSSIISECSMILPSNIIVEPIRMSIPMLHQLPQRDELYKFILQKTRPYICEVKHYQPTILSFLSDVFNKLNQSVFNNYRLVLANEHIFQTYELYKYLTEAMWGGSDNIYSRQYLLEETDSTHQCLLILAMISIVLNQAQTAAQQCFRTILTSLSVDIINTLYALFCVQEFAIPEKLRECFNSITNIMINQFIWSDQQFIEDIRDIYEQFTDSGIQTHEKQSLSCVLQKIALYISSFIKHFESQFEKELSPHSGKQLSQWHRKSLMLSLIMMISTPEILYQHCLDQIILCNMYGSSKILKVNIRFHEIISCYKDYVGNKQSVLDKVILNVKSNLNLTNNDKFKDIIQFYNTEFISFLSFSQQMADQKKNIFIIEEFINNSISFDDQRDDNNCIYTSPFKNNEQVIVLSPKLRNNRSPIHQLNSSKQIFSTNEKENIPSYFNNSINVTLNTQSQSGLLDMQQGQSTQTLQKINQSKDGKFSINLEVHGSRNPTRIKERRNLQQKCQQLCVTQKGKHPIFTQLREENQN